MQMPQGHFEDVPDSMEAETRKAMTMKRTPPARVMYVGQEVEINGCYFKVRKITNKDVTLRGIPQPI
jgi:hypothetical protein